MKKTVKTILVTSLAIGSIITGCTYANGMHNDSNQTAVTQQALVNQNHAKLLKHTKKLAEQGKVITTEKFGFGIGTPRKEIEAKWRQPTRKYDGESDYENRSTQFNFSFDKENTVYWVYTTTTDKSYKPVSYEEMKRTLGKPVSEFHYEEDKNDYQVVYQTGKYELNFHFYKKNGRMGNILSVDVVDRAKV